MFSIDCIVLNKIHGRLPGTSNNNKNNDSSKNNINQIIYDNNSLNIDLFNSNNLNNDDDNLSYNNNTYRSPSASANDELDHLFVFADCSPA